MSSATGTIYTGVTNNLTRRVYEHKTGLMPGFTSKYKCNRLAYFEQTTDVKAAVQRESEEAQPYQVVEPDMARLE